MGAPKRAKVYELLNSLGEGDQFELGKPFLFDPQEPLVWRCEESMAVSMPSGVRVRVVLHVYFRSVMLRAFVALLDPVTGKVQWEGMP